MVYEESSAEAPPESHPLQAKQKADQLVRCLRPGVEWDDRASALQSLVELVQGDALGVQQLLDLLKHAKEPLKQQILDRHVV